MIHPKRWIHLSFAKYYVQEDDEHDAVECPREKCLERPADPDVKSVPYFVDVEASYVVRLPNTERGRKLANASKRVDCDFLNRIARGVEPPTTSYDDLPEDGECVTDKGLAQVGRRCEFMQHCKANAATLGEHDWYEAQVDYYTNYIKSRDDWEFVSVYTDAAVIIGLS